MAVKKGNKRIMVTLNKDSLEILQIIMKQLKTKQPSKAIQYVLTSILSK